MIINRINNIETFYLNKIKTSSLFRSRVAQKFFSILNYGNSYWHLVAKTNDTELLDIVQGLKISPNEYNKEGLAPIHQYLISLIKFKKIKETENAPYFDLDKDFFERFIEQGIDLSKMWVKPVLSSWREKKKNGQPTSNEDHNFNFPSLYILGYPIEILFLLYKDFFTYHEMPNYVFEDELEKYDYLFHKLFLFDDKDLSAKEKLNSQYNIKENIVYDTNKISIFMINYIAGERGFYPIFPLLRSNLLDFGSGDDNNNNQFLHFLFGKIKSYQQKLPERLQIRLAEDIYNNPNFKVEFLQTSNNMNVSPINIFNKSPSIFLESIRLLMTKTTILGILEEHSTNDETVENEDDTSWKI